MGTSDGEDVDRYRSSADLVLAGGGVKGIAHVGALRALHEAGYIDHPRVAGTSVGALIGAMIADGRPFEYVHEHVMQFPFASIEDRSFVGGLPLVGTPAALLTNYGVCKGDRLLAEAERHLGDKTFAELRDEWAQRRAERGLETADIDYPFTALATDITRGELVQFPRDLHRYDGMTEANTRVADIVRASASVPLFFEPAEFGGSLFVDGGVLANFATDIFDREPRSVVHTEDRTTLEYASRWPTFGVSLLYKDRAEDVGIDLISAVAGDAIGKHVGLLGLGRFSQGLIGTLVAGQDGHAASNPRYARRTVRVDTRDAEIIDFQIEPARRELVEQAGYAATRDFLDGAWQAEPHAEAGFGFDGRKHFPLPSPLLERS